MNKLLNLIIVTTVFNVSTGFCQSIKIPAFNDKYSSYVKQLEGGNLDIDYVDFRKSFLKSKQFQNKFLGYDSLKKEVYNRLDSSDYQGVINLTKEMLSLDYTSMFAHMYLQKTYKTIGDSANCKKYHDIEFGLIYSILRSGDGKTCETAWEVTQIEEEYFVINTMLDGRLSRQSLKSAEGNICDQMDIMTDKGDKTYFFKVNEIFAARQKMLKGK